MWCSESISGERCDSVDCIEGSSVRAQIGRERCKDLKNVKVYCSNFFDISFEPLYDIVTLIGVWEYSPVFIDFSRRKACLEVLNLAKSALDKNGLLLIAIENKIGLKYWSGAPEDHTGRPFDGIHGYPEMKGAVTFSQSEIESLLHEAGFSDFAFYYCFPDYKFSQTVLSELSDESEMFLHNWISTPFVQRDSKRKFTFHEGLAAKTLSEAGLLRQFANSFLIVASQDKQDRAQLNPTWIARNYSGFNRVKKQRCITELTNLSKPQIIKRPLSVSKKEFFEPSLNSINLKLFLC